MKSSSSNLLHPPLLTLPRFSGKTALIGCEFTNNENVIQSLGDEPLILVQDCHFYGNINSFSLLTGNTSFQNCTFMHDKVASNSLDYYISDSTYFYMVGCSFIGLTNSFLEFSIQGSNALIEDCYFDYISFRTELGDSAAVS